jgi:hypothetical protein
MNKEQAEGLTSDVLIADALLRIKAIENILISKGIFTREEFQEELQAITRLIAKSILEKAKVPGDLDELIKNLQDASSPKEPRN